jgi:hypothetical protein
MSAWGSRRTRPGSNRTRTAANSRSSLSTGPARPSSSASSPRRITHSTPGSGRTSRTSIRWTSRRLRRRRRCASSRRARRAGLLEVARGRGGLFHLGPTRLQCQASTHTPDLACCGSYGVAFASATGNRPRPDSNEASMASRPPQPSSDPPVPLLVEPPPESNRRPLSRQSQRLSANWSLDRGHADPGGRQAARAARDRASPVGEISAACFLPNGTMTGGRWLDLWLRRCPPDRVLRA